MLSVLLDACVLFPMYLRDTLLSTAEAGLYVPYWSQEILDEAMGNLVLKGKISTEKAINLEETIKAAFPEAMVKVPVELEEVMTNNPKDRHVLAAAVVARVDILVTDNLTDFDTKALTPWNIKAQSPDDFLSNLFDDYPEEMVQVVRKQSQKYRKRALTLAELLSFLSKTKGANLVKFAGKVSSFEFGDHVV
ncbi:PIN domain-containing protein [Komarekiella sp. 'clone 1']|uniref:PIN domain-containing protein n=1 Tax=Komarekiella delphini-convector SJRDD-AB1 TaxID=2593771 RepID=A0AA40T2C5_9NOST|nr:PIN domain-containing protein [Komarekiella delphini-convector]MBD6619646.1 PIN domain-containing protein [Komarekiella delphini-convector SJRDD-AB1]